MLYIAETHGPPRNATVACNYQALPGQLLSKGNGKCWLLSTRDKALFPYALAKSVLVAKRCLEMQTPCGRLGKYHTHVFEMLKFEVTSDAPFQMHRMTYNLPTCPQKSYTNTCLITCDSSPPSELFSLRGETTVAHLGTFPALFRRAVSARHATVGSDNNHKRVRPFTVCRPRAGRSRL